MLHLLARGQIMKTIRNDWNTQEINALYNQPFNDLLYQAHGIYRTNFNPNEIQVGTLLNIKSGLCPEDCAYCPQSAHYRTNVEKHALMSIEEVTAHAKIAKKNGATRFCLGAAWRTPPKKDLPKVAEMIKAIKKLELESCATLGMLNESEALTLKKVGLDFYNHNLDTSPEYYEKIISTRTYKDRLDTLKNVRKAEIKVCCGGILGMGETQKDRIEFLQQLANLPKHPESIPINQLIKITGTPLGQTENINPFEVIRTIATARILMPYSVIRLTAGREYMTDEMQALCFFAGANSIFIGEKLLTAPNPTIDKDKKLLAMLGITMQTTEIA